ncbi:hypothetical protein H8959_006777 [Pygathrix nigripes]
MLGHSIRRFTTSVVRRSHYEEGPGKGPVRKLGILARSISASINQPDAPSPAQQKALGWLLKATAVGVWLKAELEVVGPEMKVIGKS